MVKQVGHCTAMEAFSVALVAMVRGYIVPLVAALPLLLMGVRIWRRHASLKITIPWNHISTTYPV